MTSRIFLKILALFALLLAIHSIVIEITFRKLPETASHVTFERLLLPALLAFTISVPIAAWVAVRVANRLGQVVDFARRIASGDLSARILQRDDELASMEAALNQTAVRLGESFAEIENRRMELAAILDSMQEAVVAVTAEGQVMWSNSVMQRIAGTQIRAGRPLAHSVRDPDLLACVKAALETREPKSGRASSLAPGRVFEINAAALPAGGALAVLHDLTAIKRAESSRRDFIANVSHELRTPLTSIQGYVETLIDTPSVSETSREFLAIIQKSARRMGRLTEDLLALASVESPDYKLAKQPIKASALVEDAIESLGGLLIDSGVSLQNAGAPAALVQVDPDAMNQVFGNLIENALKYAGDGGKVLVGAAQIGNEVEFFVRDFGPGIASEHLERIFERFYRVDKARSRESGGTGLGLAIVAQIVQAHGGHIRAESDLGSGSTFFFALPVVA